MTSDRFHFSYQDFTKMYSVKCSIYNGATEEIPVSVGMTLSPDYKELSSYFENQQALPSIMRPTGTTPLAQVPIPS